MQQYREAIAKASTAEEAQSWGDLSLNQQREFYGLGRPPAIPASRREEYEEGFGWAESNYITTSRNLGLTSDQVRGLRDDAVALGQEVGYRGRPASDEEINRVLDRHRISEAQRPALVKLWRQVEGRGGDGA